MEHSITLNLAVYSEMDSWVEAQVSPCWFGSLDSDEFISASVEPSGLLVSGNIDSSPSQTLWHESFDVVGSVHVYLN